MARFKIIATFSFYCAGEETFDYIKGYIKGLLERFKDVDLPENITLDDIEVEEE